MSIAVVGGGIVGLSCALWLQQAGYQVTLIEKNDIGAGASYGNACTIADYACIPVNNPQLPKQLAKLLFGKYQPLTIDPLYCVKNLPWFWSFLRQCQQQHVQSTIQHLGTLLRQTYAGFDPLIKLSGCQNLLQSNGVLYVYQNAESFDNNQISHQLRRDQGVDFSVIKGAEINELEPNLRTDFQRALWFKNASHLVSPQQLCQGFFKTMMANGGAYLNGSVSAINSSENGVMLHVEGQASTSFDQVVVACGAFSTQIAGLTHNITPLGVERGYHLQYNDQALLQRPVGWAEAGFYATPMAQGTRFAGTVELAAHEAPMRKANLTMLEHRARQLLDLNDQNPQPWLGHRPTHPDALPVIDRHPKDSRVLLAYGHQHIGLTLAGITGKLIAQLAKNTTPEIDLHPYRANRFC